VEIVVFFFVNSRLRAVPEALNPLSTIEPTCLITALIKNNLGFIDADPEDHRSVQGENPPAFGSVWQEAVDFEFSQHG
jgi:hypothetical protein